MELELLKSEMLKKCIEPFIIYFSPILGFVVLFVVQKGSFADLFSHLLLSFLLSSLFLVFLKVNHSFYRSQIRHQFLFYGCYFFSFFWLGLSGIKESGCIWLLLSMFAALDAGMELAVICDVFLMAEYAFVTLDSRIDLRFFITYFILGLVIAFLFSMIQKWQELGYLFLVILPVNAGLQFFAYGFHFQEMAKHLSEIGEEFVSLMALFLTALAYLLMIRSDLCFKRVVVWNKFHFSKDENLEMNEAAEVPVGAVEEKEEDILKETSEKELTDALEETSVKKAADAPEETSEKEAADVSEETPEKEAGDVSEETLEKEAEDVLEETLEKETEDVSEEISEKEAEVSKEPLEQEVIESLEVFSEDKPDTDVEESEIITEKLEEKELFYEEEHLPDETEILTKLLQPDYYLLRQLRQFSPRLYDHSQKISALSGGAARMAGGNELLARAGGMYHEIGRIESGNDNYIVTGERIGKQAGFPDSLLAIIRQHSPAYENPKSLEACVVMLSDSIISMGDYLVQNGQREKFPDEYLIENIFQKRISKGNLKDLHFSIQEIENLKKYFIRYTSITEN